MEVKGRMVGISILASCCEYHFIRVHENLAQHLSNNISNYHLFYEHCENQVFASSSSMRYHQRVVHSGEKPFKCNMCDKVFNRNDTLQTHIASHSDLKPFMCSVCGKQFGRRHVR